MRIVKTFILLFCLFFCVGESLAATGIGGDSTINQCDEKTYTITLTNDQPADSICNIVVTDDISRLAGFSYVNNSSQLTSPGCIGANINPAISGSDLSWDLDALCGGNYQLAAGESVVIEYDLATDCDAVSGSNVVNVAYEKCSDPGTPLNDTSELAIEVLPGAVSISVDPSSVSASLGDQVAWNLVVENTGLGTIENVVVTAAFNPGAVLDPGLSYDESTPAGNVVGNKVTWASAQVPALDSMAPGDTVTIALKGTVVGCDNIDMTADVRFSCDGITACFDTSTDGGTAGFSVQREVKTPLLSFILPPIELDYCQSTSNYTVTVNNTGDGDATNIKSIVDFSGLAVSNVQTNVPEPATYDGTRFSIPDIDAGEALELEFDLTQSDWCGGSFPASPILWVKEYQDECGNPFYPSVETQEFQAVNNTPELTVNKTGPSVIQLGDTATYNIEVSYTGATSCGGGSTGNVTVTDTVPARFTVDSAASNLGDGTWTPGPDGTGGTIVWDFDPAVSPDLAAVVVLQSPGTNECETACLTIPVNQVEATVTDCCGCVHSESASVSTAIECQSADVTSEKTADPATGERCDAIEYTNTYNFGDNPGITLNELTFTEHAEENHAYEPGSLEITLDGIVQNCGGITDNTGAAGGTLEVALSDCPATEVSNKTLVISYTLNTPSANGDESCSDSSFYSWSSLNLGPDGTGTGACLADGTIHETVEVGIEAPAMAVSVTGLGNIIDSCARKDVTINLTRNSAAAEPRDITLKLSGLNYYVTPGTITCSGGVLPDNCTTPGTQGSDYVWTFANKPFSAAGESATIELEVQKKCGEDSELKATALYDDKCNGTNGITDGTCEVTASATPTMVVSGDILIEKTPEIYQANSSEVTWIIYVTNRGAGTAYDVWVDDVLGSGLVLSSTAPTVDPAGGANHILNQDHNGGAINGVSFTIESMAAGEKRTIEVHADLVGCTDLTNDVSASWGCGSSDCQNVVTDSSIVKIPVPQFVYTEGFGGSSLTPCSTHYVTITGKNAGQSNLYEAEFVQTLPAGMTYIADTTQWRLNGGAWNGPGGFEPNTGGGTLTWTMAQINALGVLAPKDTIEIQFEVKTACDWAGGNAELEATYKNPCQQIVVGGKQTFTVSVNEIELDITKTRTSPAAGEPLGCGANATWEIAVKNVGSVLAPIVWLEDTLAAGFTFLSSTGGGHNAGQLTTWELTNLAAGATATVTLTAASSGSGNNCEALDNSVAAYWGCGTPDGDPATKPGEEGNDTCLNSSNVPTVTNSSVRDLDLNLSSSISPNGIGTCDGSTTVTLTINNGSSQSAYNFDAVVTLPANLTYIPGSARVDGVAAADPAVNGQVLTFYDVNDLTNNIIDELAAGTNLELTFDVQASCYQTADLNARIYYYDCCGLTQHHDDIVQNIPQQDVPVLAVEVSPATQDVPCGNNATFTVKVTNASANDAEFVVVEATLGADLTYVSADSVTNDGCTSAPYFDSNNNTVTWEIRDLDAIDSVSMDIVARYDAAGTGCDSSRRGVSARAKWGCDPDDDIDCDSTTTDDQNCTASGWSSVDSGLINSPNLTISSFTASCNADGSVTLSGVVTNSGTGAANGVVLDLYLEGSPDTLLADDLAVTPANIAAGGTGTFTHTTAPLLTGVARTFRAEVDPADAICECNESDNTGAESVTCQAAALGIDKTIPSVVRDGVVINNPANLESNDIINYRVEVTNSTTTTAYNVTLTDELPTPDAQFTYVNASSTAAWPDPSSPSSANPSGVGTAASPLVWNWETGSDRQVILEPGEHLVLDFQVKAGPGIAESTTYTNKATVNGEDGSGSPLPESSDTVDITGGQPALNIDNDIIDVIRNGVHLGAVTTVQPGDIVLYQTTIRNVGNGTAYDVNFTNTLPDNFVYKTDGDATDGTYSVSGGGASGNLGIPAGGTVYNSSIGVTLPAGETLTTEYYAVVTSGVEQGQSLTNYAETYGVDINGTEIPDENPAVGDTSDPDPDDTDADDIGQETLNIVQPALKVDKDIIDIQRAGASMGTAGPVEVGDIIVYQYTIENVGGGIAYGVDFTDILPVGLQYDTSLGDGTYSVDSPATAATTLGIADGAAGTITANIDAQINGGGTLTAVYRMLVTSGVQGTALVNIAEATGEDGAGTEIPDSNPNAGDMDDNDPDDPDADDTGRESIQLAVPALRVDKYISDITRGGASVGTTGPVYPGDIIEYTYVIENIGQGTAYDVDFTDILPANLEYETSAGDGVYSVDLPLTALTTLGVADGATGTITADISAEIAGGGTLTAVYRVLVTSITGVENFINSAEATGHDSSGGEIPDSNPAVGDTSDADVEDPDPDDTGIAMVGTARAGFVTDKQIVAVNGAPPGAFVEVGDIITYSYSITNVGVARAVNVTAKDTLPAGFEYQAGSSQATWPLGSSTDEPVVAGSVITWNWNAALDGGSPAGDRLTVEYDVLVTTGAGDGSNVNIAEASGDNLDGTPVAKNSADPDDSDDDDRDDEVVNLERPLLDLEKSVVSIDLQPGTNTGTQGSIVRYSLKVKNISRATAYNVVVTDVLPAGFTLLSFNGNVGTLYGGETRELFLEAQVGDNVSPGTYTNVARVNGTDKSNNKIPEVRDDADVIIEGVIAGEKTVELNKRVSRQSVQPGEVLSYTIEISNGGASELALVIVRDNLPDNFRYLPGTSTFGGTRIADPAGSDTLVWEVGPVPAGETVVLQYQVQASLDLPPGFYTNVATVGGKDGGTYGTVTATVSAVTSEDNCCLSGDKELVDFYTPVDTVTVTRDLYYYTHMAMLLSHELAGLQKVGFSGTDKLDNYQLVMQRERVVDLLEGYVPLNVGTLGQVSSLGLGMEFSAVNGDKTWVKETMQRLADESGWEGDISGLTPLLFEYYGGVPTLKGRDKNGWNAERTDKVLSPMTWGLTILAQSEELERLADRDDPASRFSAALLRWQLESKFALLNDWLAENEYFPHRFKQPEAGEALQLESEDGDYHLADQASMLLGLMNYSAVLEAAGDGKAASVRTLARKIWEVMESRTEKKTGVWQSYLKAGTEPGNEENEEAADLWGLYLGCLAADAVAETENSWRSGRYKKRVKKVVRHLLKETAVGRYLRSNDSYTGQGDDGVSLFSVTALIRMELLAGEKRKAKKHFLKLEEDFWDKTNHIYRERPVFQNVVNYSPIDMAGFTAMYTGLSEQGLLTAEETDRGIAFIHRLLTQAGLQLQERNTGSIIAAGSIHNVIPFTVVDRSDSGKRHSPVFVKEVSLVLNSRENKLATEQLGSTGASRRYGHGTASSRHYLTRTRVINSDAMAIASVYLAESGENMTAWAEKNDNSYTGRVSEISLIGNWKKYIWKNNLYSLGNSYSRGLALVHGGLDEKGGFFKPGTAGKARNKAADLVKKYEKGVAESIDPLFLEYSMAEPGGSEGVTGWQKRDQDESLTVTGVAQMGRGQLRLAESYNDRLRASGEDEQVQFLRELAVMQLQAKIEFVQMLVEKALNSSVELLRSPFELVRDSRNEPLDVHFTGQGGDRLGTVSLLLFMGETLEAASDEGYAFTFPQGYTDTFHALFEKMVAELNSDMEENSYGTLFEQGLELDMLSRIGELGLLDRKQKGEARELVAKRVARITEICGDSTKISVLRRVGKSASGKGELAGLASVIHGLQRAVGYLEKNNLDQWLAGLVSSFDDRYWLNDLGLYGVRQQQYQRGSVELERILYSELDVSLTLAMLTQGLDLLPEREMRKIADHIGDHSRLLRSNEQITAALTGEIQSAGDFDSEISQGLVLRQVKYSKPRSGQVVEYVIHVYNRCRSGQPQGYLENVRVKDILPSGVTYIAGSTFVDDMSGFEPEKQGDTLTWTLSRVKDESEIRFSVLLPDEYDEKLLKNRLELQVDNDDSGSRSCSFSGERIDELDRGQSRLHLFYYNDLNMDGKYEAGEDVISGIRTALKSDGQTEYVDKQATLSPGVYTVEPDWASVSPDTYATTDLPVQVMLVENRKSTVSIGLVSHRSAEGWVYVDKNGNGRKDKKEKGLAGVAVELMDNGKYSAYSGYDGYFKIEKIPFGVNSVIVFGEEQPYADELPPESGIETIQ